VNVVCSTVGLMFFVLCFFLFLFIDPSVCGFPAFKVVFSG
jgi:hypothetical protein